jgi:hypothetical protein
MASKDGDNTPMKEEAAAEYIGMSVSYLRLSRMRGATKCTSAPPFIRIGREAVPCAAVISLDETITANDSATLAPAQVNHALKAHFERAVALLEQKTELAADIAEWRRQVRADGLVPPVLLKLAREHLRDAEQRRKAAEAAEVEELYRQGLGLPLFDFARWAAE